MLNRAVDLLYLAKQQKIEIVLDGEQLQLKLPKNTNIDKNFLLELKENKELIIDFLKKNARNTKTQNAIIPFDRDAVTRIPLSFSQERLWFIDRLEGSVQYHMPTVLRLNGKLNKNALAFALKTILSRHEILRSVFKEEDGRGYQLIKNMDDWSLIEVNGSAYKNDRAALQQYIDSLVKQPFDLSKDYMLRAHLINLDDHENILVVTIHHIASDGWSISVLVKEVVELYSSFDEGRPMNLPPLPIQYADFAYWQRQLFAGEVLERKLAYWKNKLDGVATLQLPTDFSRPAVQSTKGASSKTSVDKLLSARLQDFSQQQGSTLFMTLLAAFKVLLFRYTGQQDICVGTPIAGRQQQDLESLIGFFVNTLALRSEVKGELPFTDLLKQVHTVTMEAYENQEIPFEKIVDEVVKERSLSMNPLFQVMLIFMNTPDVPELRLGELKLLKESFENTSAKFDIQLFITETPEGLVMTTEYCTDLFSEATITRMMEHFKQLLSSIVKEPQQQVSALSMLTITEEHQLLVDRNNTRVDYPANKNVVNLFEEQVLKTPDAIAVVFEDAQLTYEELNKQSNQLAHYLRSRGIKEDTLVPVCLERSPQMIVAIWGILKAGAAYVPIDPEYPEERISYMLEDTGATAIITSPESRNQISVAEGIEVIELDKVFSLINNQPAANLNLPIANNQLAYVIYTSGSTGKPKGAMNEHGGLANRLFWAQDYFNLTYQDVVLQKTTFCFDVSVWELIWPSLVGSKLVFAKPGGQKDNMYLKSIIEKNKVSVLHFVPSMLGVFLPDLQDGDCISLKKVLCSGEALKSSQVELFKEKLPEVELHNLYGPTEAAIDVTCWSLQDKLQNNAIIPIGKPIANTSIYILDESLRLAPPGGIGEIHIGGIQVARGYLNRAELTAQKFIQDPFHKQANSRLYKTGDLGRWMPDGNIEYLGRKDDQVKIRGYRIELGEIEAVMQLGELVSQAVVLAKNDKSGNTRLVSFYIPVLEIVKAKEKELYLDRVANWKELYDTEYSKTESENTAEEFNLIGWNSSFTGEAIPSAEMQQWVDDIITVILSQDAGNVLEIGCGTGLIYYPLAGKVKKYIGTDLSSTSINQIADRISKAARNYGPTELLVCAAHEVSLPAEEKVDTIILNSIIQYFPGEDYLNTVIKKSISLLNGSGRIIIGDVRDNRLLELFKGRLQANTLKDSTSIQEFKWAVEQEVLKENELCIDPGYFFQLQNEHPDITHVAIQWKQADYINELSLYRYTVILYVGNQQEIIEPDWQNWKDIKSENIIIDQLKEGRGIIAIKDAPNPRLWKERIFTNALQDKLVSTVGDLLSGNDKVDEETNRVTAILTLAAEKGYHYRLLLDEDPLKVNIILEQHQTVNFYQQAYYGQANRNVYQLTNVPLFIDISWQIQKDIRSMLQQKLPDYMVPSEMVALRQMPLTSNGKVDRKFLSLREEKRVINEANYLAPSTEIEHLLVTIWQELLGVEQIGIEDNFFELGGDSILTIQIVSRLRRLGYELQPKDVFIHQTIGRLAKAVADRAAATVPGEQGLLKGESGLLPIQQWYLQNSPEAVSHFNQNVLLGLDKAVTAASLQAATEQLMMQHDALRFKYTPIEKGWQQEYGTNTGVLFTEDLRSASPDSLASSITSLADSHQRSLNIEKGELARFVWMQTPDTEANNRLLLVIHHLAVDGVSWRILLEDLELMLTAIVNGKKADPGQKSSSYRQWYNQLEKYGQDSRLLAQKTYWQNTVKSYEPLPVDKDRNADARVKDTAYHSVRLNSAQTQRLLQEVPRVYHTEINDVLMSVLAKTLTAWSGKDKVIIGLEGHGREDIAEGIDISRTVGWFTSLYPVLLKMGSKGGDDELIKTVKEQLRQVPDKGLGYGVLKYINREKSLRGKDPWDILFNYLGQLDNVVNKATWLKGAGESAGAGRDEEQFLKEKLAVNSSVRAGQLVLNWSYSNKHYEAATISKLAADFIANLESLIDHCIEKQLSGVVFTPSDYGLGLEISNEELDLFLEEPYQGKPRRESIDGLYRLSGLQQGMLFHGLYDNEIVAYIEQFCCDLIDVDVELLNKSWNEVLKRHSILRSAFYSDRFNVPVQCVYKDVELTVKVLDLRGIDKAAQQLAIQEYEAADRVKGFDFTNPPLIRLELLRVTDSRYRMLWTYHHILFDGWSLPLVMVDFLTTYESLVTDSEMMPMPEDRYEDYIRYIERRDAVQEEKYWRNYLKGIEESTLLPFVKTTTERTKGSGEYKSVSLQFGSASATRIQSYAQRNRLTVNTLMQGVWSCLLHHYTGNDEITYGVIVSGRPDDLPNIEQRVGMFINTLPLRSSLQQEKKITEWLQQLQGEQVSSRQYQHTPLQNIQRWAGVQGDLFDTLMVFENYPVSKVIGATRWSLQVENLSANYQTNFPLSILITSSQEITVRFDYNAALLEDGYMNLISNHFENVLLQMIENPGYLLGDINPLTPAERNQLLFQFNDTTAALSTNQHCIELFEQQVINNPAATAVVFGEEVLSYRQLNERSNQLAHYLQSRGVKAETLVPLFVERSEAMIVGILGILKAGGAYVPIDPQYPAERISYMLEDTKAALIVTSKESRKALPINSTVDIIELDGTAQEAITSQPTGNLQNAIKPNQLAYVIYTSGSTGKPKGVMIEHSSLCNYLLNNQTKYITADKNNAGSYIHLSYTFDASITGIFMPLLSGKTIVVASGQAMDLFNDPNLLKYAPYDFIKITPSHLELLEHTFQPGGKDWITGKLVIGGEALHTGHFTSFINREVDVEVINEYGPTESTVGCSTYCFHTVSDSDQLDNGIPIGKPIDNIQLYILDKRNALVPVGVAGELCIGGAGLARGYLNRPELTAEKFIANSLGDKKGNGLYKTGDLARWLPDGNLEYLGRIDDQVKIRGYRIELGEIESVLQQCGLVSQSVVLAKAGSEGTKRLIGYIVPGEGYTKEAVTAYLRNRLPEYMVPMLWIELQYVPLTSNGKVNKKALPDMDANDLVTNEYVAPRNELEKSLAETWQKLLGIERAGINDNFFELGGDSILTIQVVSRMRRLGFELQPRDIFIHQTIARLSRAIAERSGSAASGEQGILTGHSGLLPIQQWYLEKDTAAVSHFNQAVLLGIDKSVSFNMLQQIIEQLTVQHDALRFRYTRLDGVWQQEYGNSKGAVFTEDLQSATEDSLPVLIKENAGHHQRQLDIEKGELIRAVLFQTPATESHNRVLIVIHHLAIDGVSWRILLEDMELLLSAISHGQQAALGNKSSSYRQWFNALEVYGQGRILLSQKEFWQHTVQNNEPLPVDKQYKGKVRVEDKGYHSTRLNGEQTKRLLQEVPRVYHTEINDMLLCALAGTLCEWGSRSKVVIGLEGHGRETIAEGIDTSRTVGWFTSLYPLLLEPAITGDAGEQIKSVKEQLRRVPGHGLGYGVLKYINREPFLQDGSDWDIVFNYLGQFDNVVNESKWLTGAGESSGTGVNEAYEVSEKISVNGFIQSGELVLNWGYSGLHYEAGTIAGLAEAYLSRLENLIAHCLQQQQTGQVFTPSDFGLGAEISYPELDAFLDEPLHGKKRKEQVESIYRLSALQRGMLFHGLYDERVGAYTEQFNCDLLNPNLEQLTKSWQYVLNNHSILRSGFYADTFTVPVQCVYRQASLPVEVLDYRGKSNEEQLAAIAAFEAADREKSFDFKSAPLMRISLLQLSDERYRMLFTYHHILFDGWSLPVLMEEFLNGYELLAAGRPVKEQEEDKYEDYIRYIERGDKGAEEIYWRGYLRGVEQSTLLPFVNSTTERTKGTGSYQSLVINIDAAATEKIQAYAQRNRLTVNTIMQGVWSILLHHYTGHKDVLYGVTVSGRPDDLPNVEKRVGMFINTLPLHSSIEAEQKLGEWLQLLQEQQVSSRHYQYTPLTDIQGWSGLSGDIFDNILIFENYPVSEIIGSKKWSLNIENIQAHAQNNYPLSIVVSSTEKINIGFNYNSALLDEVYVQQITGHFENVLQQLVNSDGTSCLQDINLLTTREKQQLLVAFNKTETAYPKDKSMVDMFEEQVRKNPEAIAVCFEEEMLSYKVLNERSNQVAHYLSKKGVTKETLVPICIDRGPAMIIGILGILKAGGAYVPMDTEYPEERIRYMLEDTAATIAITSKSAREKLPATANLEIIEIDSTWPAINKESTANLQTIVLPNQLAYIIFTSGSTGKPKGVMIEQSGVVNLALSQSRVLEMKAGTRFLQFASFGFDASCYEIFTAVLTGANLILCNKEDLLSAEGFETLVNRHQVEIAILPPSFQHEMKDSLGTIKTIMSAGEPLNLVTGKYIQSNGVRLINAYGPTENTVCATLTDHPIMENDTIVIGKPIDNVQAYVLNENKQLVPAGVTGELCLAGAGIARGYLNRTDLTAEKFIANPFSKDPLSRIYLSGDLVRMLPDGNIEYIGRKDDQVKIRGYRIELGEIEAVLLQSGLVSQAIVMALPDASGNRRLVSYVVSDGNFDKPSAIAYLNKNLPDYMVPAMWVELDRFPLTASGKVDKKALTDQLNNQLSNSREELPRNQAEKVLAEMWQEMLEVEQIGVNDDFFELGGHSLLAIRLVSAIRKVFGVEMPISTIFDYPTIAQLAAQITNQATLTMLPSIEVAGKRPERIPLSFGQERLWFIDRLEGSLQYHIPSVMRLEGDLNRNALEHAIKSVINRHEALRTVFLEKDGDAYQVVKNNIDWKLPVTEGSEFKNDDPGLQQLIRQLISTPFDLSKDYMVRANLVMLHEQEHILVVTLHHIASDGWSVSILVKEVVELYNAYEECREAVLAPLPIQYADFAIWQRNNLQGSLLDTKLGYWLEKLKGVEPLQMLTDFPRPAIQTNRGARTGFSIDKELAASLQQLSQQQGSTLFMTLLTAFQVLLHRYSGQKDICVGTGIAGRQQQEVEGLIGFFINTLALRSAINPEESFSAFLQQVRKTTLDAYENQEVPFEKVVDGIIKHRDRSRNPVFQVMFVLQNTPEVPVLQLGELQLFMQGTEHTTAQFDISLSITEHAHGLGGSLEYNADLYKKDTMERLGLHFSNLLSSIVANPGQSIASLEMLSTGERQQLLLEFNDAGIAYPKDKTIVSIIEEQVRQTPDNIALIFEDRQITYGQLNERSNQLAHYLIHKGITSETLVPICIERGIELIVAIAGVLKAGGVYVPIDPDYPLERIKYILEDTGAGIVITSNANKSKLICDHEISPVEIDSDWNMVKDQPVTNPQIVIEPSQLAYIIYTSGSTGKPKGVLIEHRNVIRLFKNDNPLYAFTAADTWCMFHSPSFDFSVWEMYGALFYGGRLVIVPKAVTKDTALFADLLIEQQVTILNQTPSAFYVLQDVLVEKVNTVPVRYVIFGGEALNPARLQPWKESFPECRLINMYGITETTVHVTYQEIGWEQIREGKSVIGKPIPTLTTYILDANRNLLPAGVVGELCVGGAGVARGYLNRPELTAEKFVDNPFDSNVGSKLYLSGDLGRWLPDGSIEYLGRKDEQVKIRGYRIEPGEIEMAVRQSNLVSQAVIIPWLNKEGNKSLVGYIVPAELYNKIALIAYLQANLPDYMIPSLWVELEQLPLTANGKIDKKALPDPDTSGMLSNQYVAPGTETEKKLVTIWQGILQAEHIGIHDNFFELGGHSLLAMRLISAVRKGLNADLSVKELFLYPTIAELGAYLHEQKKGSLLPDIEVYDRPEKIPLSFSQERLWFIDQLEGSVPYNSATVLRLKGKLNQEALSFALQNIISRHEALRTVFYEADGKPFQSVIGKDGWRMSVVDGAGYRDDRPGLQKFIEKLISMPFNLEKDYMLRADLIMVEKDNFVLVVTMHHIASDGWSLPIVVKEVVESYNAFSEGRPVELDPLPLQYADYSIWQHKYLEGEVLDKKTGYWKKKLDGVAALQLPTDYSRPAIKTVKGASVNLMIEKELSDRLNQLSQQQGTTLFMTLLATYNILLNRYSGQQDICVGTSIANRPQEELEGLIGFFVNTLALRNEVVETLTFTELLQQVKTTTLEAYENQEVPFERVVEEVVKDRDASRSPLFQVMLVLLNLPGSTTLGVGELELSVEAIENKISKFEFTFHVSQSNNGLSVLIAYNTDLYREDTIIRMASHFKQLLNSVVKEPGQTIDSLQMLTEAEEQQLLVEFN